MLSSLSPCYEEQRVKDSEGHEIPWMPESAKVLLYPTPPVALEEILQPTLL